jgi:hypothetical protein
MNLQQLQESFQAYILENEENILDEIKTSATISAIQRLDVYREGYYLRLIDILIMDFETLKKMLGDELFDQLARQYIDTYSSNHFSVRYFGRHFAKFLESNASVAPIYSEMAKFEWALSSAHDAQDAPHLSVDDISKISPELWAEMRFALHPSIELLPFFSNAPEIWRNIDAGGEVAEVKYQSEPHYWLVWRFNLQTFFIPLNQPELVMLQSIQTGKTFSAVCEDLCDWLAEEEVIQFAASTLRNWVTEGIFSKVWLENNTIS